MHRFLTTWASGTPNPQAVQGSTVDLDWLNVETSRPTNISPPLEGSSIAASICQTNLHIFRNVWCSQFNLDCGRFLIFFNSTRSYKHPRYARHCARRYGSSNNEEDMNPTLRELSVKVKHEHK